MFEYTIRKPPDNILGSQPIHQGLTGAVLGLKMTKMAYLTYILTHMSLKT